MDHQPTSTAPDAGGVLKFVASAAWRSKWLIGIATIVVATLAFALAPSNTVEAWSGRATLRIGLAPASEYILIKTGAPLTPIDSQRDVVARISDPGFRQQVASNAAFDPATATTSRSMVISSLRGIVLDGDRDVAIELTATSSADVRAAFHAIAVEIGKMHDAILNRRLELLQGRIDDSKRRVTAIEKSNTQFNERVDQLNNRIISQNPNDKTISPMSILPPTPTTAIPAWNELQDRIQQDESLKKSSEPSVLHLASDSYSTGARSVRTLKFSLLAGLGMLLAMIVLTVVFSRPARASED